MGDDYSAEAEFGDGGSAWGGEPAHHWSDQPVGGLPGLTGIPADQALPDPGASPDGAPLPDVVIPPPVETDSSTSWIGEAAHHAYHAVTSQPDPHTYRQPDPATEADERQQRIDAEMDKETTHRHVLPSPEIPF